MWIRKQIERINIIIPYNKQFYRINIIDGTFILYQLCCLFQRRILRLIKRIFLRSFNIFVVIICGLIFAFLVIPLGIYIQKYDNWYDGIWDLRTFVLTSILVVFVNTNLFEEKERREALKEQYYTYIDILFNLPFYFKDMLEEFGEYTNVSFSQFLTEGKVAEFLEYLSNLKYANNITENINNIDIKTNLITYNKEQINALNDLHKFINRKEKLELNKKWMRISISDLKNLFESENNKLLNDKTDYQINDLIKFLTNVTYSYVEIISYLRGPWRWDHNRNMIIRRILYNKGTLIKGEYDAINEWF